MRRFYIASHGDFSKGIKHSLEMIAGHSAVPFIHIVCIQVKVQLIFGELKSRTSARR